MIILMTIYQSMNGIAQNVGFLYKQAIDVSIAVILEIIKNEYNNLQSQMELINLIEISQNPK